jgi:site-specific DNA-cytosine methylase
MVKMSLSKTKINWISVQNLIGGFAIGAENAFGCQPGLIIHCGWINDLHYIEYMNNIRKLNIPIIQMEDDYKTFTTKEDEEKFLKYTSQNEIDVTVMTPLCSGLSMLNYQNNKESSKCRGNPDNDQNQNMYNLTKLGMRLKSKVVVFENAPSAYTNSGKGVVDYLEKIAINHSYSTHLYKTDTLLHGIPQHRIRTFIIFYRDTNPPLFEYQKIQYIKLENYLNELDKSLIHYNETCCKDSKDAFYDFVLNYTNENLYLKASKKIFPDKTTTTALYLTQQIGFDKAIEFFNDQLQKNSNNQLQKKYHNAIRIAEHCQNKLLQNKGYWDSSTYMANDGLFINAVISKNIHRSLHPTEERYFNIRELLHLMGMPNNFIMKNPLKNWQQISQNVPVKTGMFIASQIKKYLQNTLQITSTTFVKQNNIKQKLDTPTNQQLFEW